jgi:hypothetical protein
VEGSEYDQTTYNVITYFICFITEMQSVFGGVSSDSFVCLPEAAREGMVSRKHSAVSYQPSALRKARGLCVYSASMMKAES